MVVTNCVDIADGFRPLPASCGRQEYSTGSLHLGPFLGGILISVPAGTASCVIWSGNCCKSIGMCVIVGEENQAVNSPKQIGLGKKKTRSRGTRL